MLTAIILICNLLSPALQEDNAPITHGDRPADTVTQGRRSDLEALHAMVKTGAKLHAICDEHGPTMLKYWGNAVKMRQMYLAADVPRLRTVSVTVLWGPTGTGKTHRVVMKEDDLYIADLADKGWYDGYDGQEAILFDEFSGEIVAKRMQRALDGYRLQLNVKGGSAWAQYSRVYITSNVDPDQWWMKEGRSTIPGSVRESIRRRIDNVYYVTNIHQVLPNF